MVQLNGFSVDARQLPASVTLQLAAKALGGACRSLNGDQPRSNAIRREK
jgi:hypothetical protein